MKKEKSRYIYAPYVCVTSTDGPSKEYTDFMSQYNKDHEVCPKCGTKEHTTTLMGYILDMDNKEKYKDLNNCKCSNCGDVHTCHERVKN